MSTSISKTRTTAIIGVMSAVAVVIYFFDFPVPLMPAKRTNGLVRRAERKGRILFFIEESFAADFVKAVDFERKSFLLN